MAQYTQKILVDREHVLHFFYVDPKLQVAGIKIGSIQKAIYRALLVQHGLVNCITEYDDSNFLKYHPEHIVDWTHGKGLRISKEWTYDLKIILTSIIRDQLNNPRSKIHRYFRELCHHSQWQVPNVKFVICYQSEEFVLTCGLRKALAEKRGSFPGANIYGVLLDKLLYRFCIDNGSVPALSIEPERLFVFNFSKPQLYAQRSVLILSDSLMRQVEQIQFGEVVARSGAKYHQLVEEVHRREIHAEEFDAVFVICGTNCCEVDKYGQQVYADSFYRLESYLLSFARHGQRPYVVMQSGIPHPSLPGLKKHSRWVEDRLRDTPIRYHNWCTAPYNPFVQQNVYNHEMYDPKDRYQLHLSHKGANEVYRTWAQYVDVVQADVQMLKFKLGNNYYPKNY